MNRERLVRWDDEDRMILFDRWYNGAPSWSTGVLFLLLFTVPPLAGVWALFEVVKWWTTVPESQRLSNAE